MNSKSGNNQSEKEDDVTPISKLTNAKNTSEEVDALSPMSNMQSTKNQLSIITKNIKKERALSERKIKETNQDNDEKSSSNVLDSNSDKDEDPNNSNDENTELSSGTIRKKRFDEIFRMEMRKNLANQMMLPPPEELFKRTVIENEQARTGAPIPFIKFGRLMGQEKVEELNPDNKTDEQPDLSRTDIAPAQTITDYLINAKQANKLVYCRFGEKYVQDLEKRKNSNISSLNAPS